MKRSEDNSALAAFDRQFFSDEIRFLAGVDEAGRGPLAGPVVAAAVILPEDVYFDGLNDSKQVGPGQRERLFQEIRQKAVTFGIGSASVDEIKRLNILQATFLAMRRAVEQLNPSPDFILVDGRDFPSFLNAVTQTKIAGKAVIKGDASSRVIAAASILAKVHRDHLMEQYAIHYPQYGFEKHKGYGTREHREKILKWGPCPIHREKFIRKLLSEQRSLF